MFGGGEGEEMCGWGGEGGEEWWIGGGRVGMVERVGRVGGWSGAGVEGRWVEVGREAGDGRGGGGRMRSECRRTVSKNVGALFLLSRLDDEVRSRRSTPPIMPCPDG